jgi:hypothetical protein
MDVLREQHGRSPLPYWKGGGSRVLLPWKEVQHLFCTSITPLLLTDNCQGRAVSGEGWPVIQHVGGTGEGAWPWKRSAIAQARLWAAARNRASGVTSKTASAHSVLATPCGMNVSITSAARACSAASSAASGRRPVPRHARASSARAAARRRSRPNEPPACSGGRAAAARVRGARLGATSVRHRREQRSHVLRVARPRERGGAAQQHLAGGHGAQRGRRGRTTLLASRKGCECVGLWGGFRPRATCRSASCGAALRHAKAPSAVESSCGESRSATACPRATR